MLLSPTPLVLIVFVISCAQVTRGTRCSGGAAAIYMNLRTASVGSDSLRAQSLSAVRRTLALRLSHRASKCRLRSTSGRPQSRRTKHNICPLRKASSIHTMSTSSVCSSAPRHRRRSQVPLPDSPAMDCFAGCGHEYSSESYWPPPRPLRLCRLTLRSPEKVKDCKCMAVMIARHSTPSERPVK